MNDNIKVAALGQTLMTRGMRKSCPEHLEKWKDILSVNDFVVSNFEPALQIEGVGESTRTDGSPFHAAGSDILEEMRHMNINLVSMASNHKWDLGTQSILESLTVYDSFDFAYSGVGENLRNAYRAQFITLPNGLRGGIVAAATKSIRGDGAATDTRPGVAEIPYGDGRLDIDIKNEVLAEIKRASKECDFLVFVYHNHIFNGFKNNKLPVMEPTPLFAVEFAKACIDCGTDMFINHGQPLLSGVEIYKDKVILYNLGNFIFQPSGKKFSEDLYRNALLVNCIYSANRKVASVELVPLRINDKENRFGYPEIATGEEATRILNYQKEFCAMDFNTEIHITGNRGYIYI